MIGCDYEIGGGETCGHEVFAGGKCSAHYRRWLRTGKGSGSPVRGYGEAPPPPPKKAKKTGKVPKKMCSVCGKKEAVRQGMCWSDYEKSKGRYPGWVLRGKKKEEVTSG
jgi:hypothetical protein